MGKKNWTHINVGLKIYDDVSNRPVWWLDIISFKKRFYLATTACSNLPLLNMCRFLLTSRSPSHTMCASPAIFPVGFRKEHVAGGKNKFYPQYFVTIRRYYHIFLTVGGRKQKRVSLLTYHFRLWSWLHIIAVKLAQVHSCQSRGPSLLTRCNVALTKG